MNRQTSKFLRKPEIDLIALTFFWAISLVIVNPFGNFPLNDDWSFALTVKHLIEDGDYRPLGWASMPLITNIVWGSLFTIPAGFSYDALRLSTLVMSLLGIWATYFLSRELGLPRFFSLVSAGVVGFNPVYYALSNTFMTDVPFTSLTVIASVFFVKHLKDGDSWSLALGTTIIVIATLSRQLAVALPMGFIVAIILKEGINRQSVLRAATPFVLCVFSLFIFQKWLQTSGRLPALYHAMSDKLTVALKNIDNFSFLWGVNTITVLLYMGLFLSPLLIYTMISIFKIHKKLALIAVALSTLLLFLGHVGVNHGDVALMPVGSNVLLSSGIGPLTLYDEVKLNHVTALPSYFWMLTTLLSVVGGGLLLTALGFTAVQFMHKLKLGATQHKDASSIFLILSVFIQIAPLVLVGFFDRYLIPLIPLLGIGIASAFSPMAPTRSRFHFIPIIVLLMLFAWYSVFATKDYITWNRIRWEALDVLITKLHVHPKDIDGGFEFNGTHFYDPKYIPPTGKSWWWVQDDKFVIAFGPVKGYELVQKYSFKRWLPIGVGHIYVLRRPY